MQSIRSMGMLVCLCAALAGCALPRGAAVEREILEPPRGEAADFSVYPVTRGSVIEIATWPKTGKPTATAWPGRSPGGSSQIIAPGDRLDVIVWDNEDNSLLTSGAERSVNLRAVEVTADGTVFMPYLENVHVAGLTPEAARRSIQTQMTTIMPSAQVQLGMAAGRRNSVDLVGGVDRPGSYPLPDRDFSVLALVSQGGGVSPDLRNPQVRIMRGSTRYAMPLERLYESPALDATLRGGDKVFVEQDDRYFLSLGAAGSQRMVYFPHETVTAVDAISLVSGVNSNRGNPRSVLVLREYPGSTLRPGGRGGPETERAIFSIDLTTADGLFSARKFEIEPQDLVFVTESPANALRTVLEMLGIGAGIVRQVDLVGE